MAAQNQDERLLSETSNSLLLVDGPPIGIYPKVLAAAKERLRTAEDNSPIMSQTVSPKKKMAGANAAAAAIDSDHHKRL